YMIATKTLLANAPGDNSDLECSSDSMTILGRDGKFLRLPNYSNTAGPINLMTIDNYQIRAESLAPVARKVSGNAVSLVRFEISVVFNNQVVYHKRYASDEATLQGAKAAAVTWIRHHKRFSKFSYICSAPLLLVWLICFLLGWFLHPVVGWISFLPML